MTTDTRDQERRSLSVLRVATSSSRAGKVVFELGCPGACHGHRSRGDQSACLASRRSEHDTTADQNQWIAARSRQTSLASRSARTNWLFSSNRSDADGASDIDQRPNAIFRHQAATHNGSVLLIPWCKPPSRKFREILLPPSVSRHKVRPIKAERRTALLKAIARGRGWLDEIVSGASQGVEQIAARHKCSIRHVNMTISLAFIAPALVKAALEGRLPRGIGVATLRDAPAEWSRQFERLGLSQPD